MNAHTLARMIIRVIAIVVFLQIFTMMLMFSTNIWASNYYSSFIMLALLAICIMALSKPLAKLLVPDGEQPPDEADPPTPLSLQPLAFAAAGLLLVILGLLQMPAALNFWFLLPEMTYTPPELTMHFWLQRADTLFLIIVGIVILFRAHALSSWWRTYTFGRFEE